MDNKRLDQIEAKVDTVVTAMTEMGSDLKYHIKRTDLLENEFKPIRARMLMVDGAIKLLVLIGVILGIIEAIRALK